jgi:DMSO/TMAO reductase YedYZ heme-binding membrane subunit
MAFTSWDGAVKRMGGRAWKRVHRAVYWILPVVMFHALFNGFDFAIESPPDVAGAVDKGCLIGFTCAYMGWAVLWEVRMRWMNWLERRQRARGTSIDYYMQLPTSRGTRP